MMLQRKLSQVNSSAESNLCLRSAMTATAAAMRTLSDLIIIRAGAGMPAGIGCDVADAQQFSAGAQRHHPLHPPLLRFARTGVQCLQ